MLSAWESTNLTYLLSYITICRRISRATIRKQDVPVVMAQSGCILLYAPSDVNTIKFFIENPMPREDLDEDTLAEIKEKDYERLRQMTFYATTRDCLREFILRYFGERAPHYCGNCSNCLTEFEKVDYTVQAQMILSCVYRCEERYGITMICDVLRGSQNQRVLHAGLNDLSTYGFCRIRRIKRSDR